MHTLPTLYKRTSTGATQIWTITSDGGGYFTDEGLVGGKITRSSIHTCKPTNVGKANATTAATQASKEALAVWKKKKDKGYTEVLTDIDDVTFKRPMKGDKFLDRVGEIDFKAGVDVQYKYNGIRAQSEQDRTYSTGGKTFYTIPHIRKALAPIFEHYPDAFIDGELFNYDYKKNLNRLVELVSVGIKPKDLTPELLAESESMVQLHVFDGYGFDGITPGHPYAQRHAAVIALINEFKSPYLHNVESKMMYSEREIRKELAKNKKAGGEGLMLRHGTCEFKHGRSKYMLKLKHFDDKEFKVLDVQEGNGSWKGCAKRIILELGPPGRDKDGNPVHSFASNIDGDTAWLKKLYENKDKVINGMATVEYQQMSEYGIPQLPWVRVINRNYE